MLCKSVGCRVALLLGLSSGCAGAVRGGAASSPDADAYTLRVDMTIAGDLANDRGQGEIRADLTGELTFAAADAGTQVHSRILAVRDVFVDPALTRRSDGPDARVLRTVLLATDDYWSQGSCPAVTNPAPSAGKPPIAFFYEVFTRDLAPPAWLPVHTPPEGSSFRSRRRGLHGGIESDIEETLTLVRVDRSGPAPVAEYAHLSAVRSVPSLGVGPRLSLAVHERGVLFVDLTSGRPLRHTRQRTELLAEDGADIVRNTMTIDATYTTVAP